MKKVLFSLLFVIMLFGTFGCTLSKNKDVVGTYSFSKMITDGEETDAATLESLGLTITFEMKSNNTAVMSIFGEEINFTYDDKTLTTVPEDGEEKVSTPYTYKNGVLSFEDEGTTLEFTKNK